MNEPDETPPKQNYKWPWFVLAAVVLFVVLAIVWVSFAVKKVEQERDFNAPVPAGRQMIFIFQPASSLRRQNRDCRQCSPAVSQSQSPPPSAENPRADHLKSLTASGGNRSRPADNHRHAQVIGRDDAVKKVRVHRADFLAGPWRW